METMVNRCISSEFLTTDASIVVLNFYKEFKEVYPELELDAIPSDKTNGFMFSLDDSRNHIEFELVYGVWEFFY